MSIDLQAKPAVQASSKPIPTSFACAPRLQFSYSGSPDGIDTNLLILLHGRGDSEAPFAKLASSLRLPQTATLALRGPLVVPLLDEHEREWWNETDMMGMNVPNPDPSKAVKLLCDIVDELRGSPFDWQVQHIHLFGFVQGGTLAVETALRYGRARITEQLASVVSIQGPLLSLPSKAEAALNTKVLYVYRSRTAAPSAKVKADVAALERGFSHFKSLRLPETSNGPIEMPNSKQEWEGIMAFWSEQLQSTSAWQRQGEVYEVTGGQSAVKLPEKSGMAQARKSTNTAGAENIIEPPAKSSTSSVATDASTPKAKPQAPSGLKRGFLSRGL